MSWGIGLQHNYENTTFARHWYLHTNLVIYWFCSFFCRHKKTNQKKDRFLKVFLLPTSWDQDHNYFSKFSPRLRKFLTKNVAILRENMKSIFNGLIIRTTKSVGKKEMRASVRVNEQMLKNALKAFTFSLRSEVYFNCIFCIWTERVEAYFFLDFWATFCHEKVAIREWS